MGRDSDSTTLADLMDRARLDVGLLASRSRVSHATIYRARNGYVPPSLQVWALSVALSVTEDELRAAIVASAAKGGTSATA